MSVPISRPIRWILAASVAAVLAAVLWAVVSVSVDRPVAYDAIVEQFKYGSIGSEPGVSLLRPVGGVLPPYLDFPRPAGRSAATSCPAGTRRSGSSSNRAASCQSACRGAGGSGSTRRA